MDGLLPQSIGWYGKLPSRGDFVGRGIPRTWLRTWDEWLQRGLADAAQRLGAAALRERLLTMSAWQCVVLPQRPGEPAWNGVVAASSDRVGRAFPLLVAEAYDEKSLEQAELAALQARARCLAEWLHHARALPSPKEFESSAAKLGATPWNGRPDAAAQKDSDGGLAALRESWPAAASFWWRAEPTADMRAPLAEAWPPREALLLELLGESV